MSKPVRIRLSRAKGFNLQEHSRSINGLDAVKVDRSTRFGNPFYVGKSTPAGLLPLPGRSAFFACHDAHECVRGFSEGINDGFRFMRFTKKDLEHLRGKNLACWCKPGNPCHADVLIEYMYG